MTGLVGRRAPRLAAVILVLATVGACRGDGAPAGNRLDAVDFEFRPHAVSVRAGRQATIRVTNKGKATHNVSIPAIGADIDYRPGRSENLIFIVPDAGPVEFFCKYHQARGMTGTFVLRD